MKSAQRAQIQQHLQAAMGLEVALHPRATMEWHRMRSKAEIKVVLDDFPIRNEQAVNVGSREHS